MKIKIPSGYPLYAFVPEYVVVLYHICAILIVCLIVISWELKNVAYQRQYHIVK